MTFALNEIALPTGRLSYRVGGNGRPLVHIHSAGGPRITAPLSTLASTHKVLLPVIPGYDGTPMHSGPVSIRALAGIVAAFIDTVVGERCDVMGQSLGGWVALWLAADRPDLVDQMVLQCPAGLRVATPGAREVPDSELRLSAYPERKPVETRTPAQVAENRTVMARYAGDVRFDAALAERLGSIDARTLILLGTLDNVIPAATGVLLKNRLPRSHLSYIFDAAHSLDVDQPERVCRLVKAFLEKGPAFIVREPAQAT